VSPAMDERERVAREYFDAAAARDPDRMAACWADDGIDDILPTGILRGPDEVREYMREQFTALPDARMTVERVVVGDDVVVVQWRLAGTHTGGPLLGVEPTGRHVEIRGCDLLEISDGKIHRNTAYVDGLGIARALGLMPVAGSGAERALIAGYNQLGRLREAVKGLGR
jgi:steroid delta-isomerase-like uncharacterized protein